MIRIIRLLGAALGAFIGLGLGTTGLFQETGTSYGLILAGWTVAWLIVGFAILGFFYLTFAAAYFPQYPMAKNGFDIDKVR